MWSDQPVPVDVGWADAEPAVADSCGSPYRSWSRPLFDDSGGTTIVSERSTVERPCAMVGGLVRAAGAGPREGHGGRAEAGEPGAGRVGRGSVAEFRLLGLVETWSGGRRVPMGQPRQRLVLAALLVDAGRPVTSEALEQRVLGRHAAAAARHALHEYLARIRRMLAGLDGDGVVRLTRRGGVYVLERRARPGGPAPVPDDGRAGPGTRVRGRRAGRDRCGRHWSCGGGAAGRPDRGVGAAGPRGQPAPASGGGDPVGAGAVPDGPPGRGDRAVGPVGGREPALGAGRGGADAGPARGRHGRGGAGVVHEDPQAAGRGPGGRAGARAAGGPPGDAAGRTGAPARPAGAPPVVGRRRAGATAGGRSGASPAATPSWPASTRC